MPPWTRNSAVPASTIARQARSFRKLGNHLGRQAAPCGRARSNRNMSSDRHLSGWPATSATTACVRQTIERDLPNETSFLRSFDTFRAGIENMVDMPERTRNNLFGFLRQNQGKPSKRALSEEDVVQPVEKNCRACAAINVPDAIGASALSIRRLIELAPKMPRCRVLQSFQLLPTSTERTRSPSRKSQSASLSVAPGAAAAEIETVDKLLHLLADIQPRDIGLFRRQCRRR